MVAAGHWCPSANSLPRTVEEWLAEQGHFDIEKLSHQDLKKYRKQLV